MDNKYVINADANGRINFVGIRTEEGKMIIEELTGEDSEAYIAHLIAINNRYGGDFFDSVNNNKVEMVRVSVFEEEQRKQILEQKQASEELKKKAKRKRMAKTAVAAALIIALAGTSVSCLNKKIKENKERQDASNSTSQVQMIDEDGEVVEAEGNTEVNLENKSVSELIDMLDDENREQAITKIVNVQDYFNNEAAPTVKQGDKQLYFTFDETTAAYLYGNAKTLSSSKIASFFGQSNIMVLNEETGEYEQIDKDLAAAKYLSFCTNLSYYYQLGATKESGVDKIFENEKEAEFYRDFEAKILEYNRTKSDKVKAEIVEMLEDIYMSGNIDALKDKYPGASSIIATAIVPYLHLNNVITKDMYKSIVEINETITCQDIYSQIEKITDKMDKANGKEAIIEQIAKLQNEKYKNLDRNISMEESLEGYKLSDLDKTIVNTTPSFKENKTVTKHYTTTTTSRSEAVKKTSESQVKQAEKKADEKAGINKKNQDENDYWDGYQAGYNKAYDNVWNGGSGNVSTSSGSSKYKEGFRDGVSTGIKAAKEDLAQAEKDKENYKPTTKPDKVVEETFVPENNKDNNDKDKGGNNKPSQPEPQPEPTPEPTQPKEEIIEETFVYENDTVSETQSESKSSKQKVKSVESHESLDNTNNNTYTVNSKDGSSTYEVTQESESVVKVRVIPNN